MDPRQITHVRLATQGVARRPFASAAEAVRWLGAVQAQEYGPAKWGVGQRVIGAVEADLDRAIAEGAILRTHVLRPTWHFVAAEDIRWMLALTAPRVHRAMASYNRALELDEQVFRRSHALIAKALRDGRHATRAELAAALEAGGIVARGQRLGHLVMHAELEALICSGAPRRRQQTYALLEERAPPAPALNADEALAALTRRYFRGHGPATAKDLGWWASLTVRDAQRGIEMVRGNLERFEAGGLTYWADGEAAGAPPPPSPSRTPAAHLLQGYDELFVGYSESRLTIDLDGRVRNAQEAGAMAFLHVLLVDGQVAGRWRRRAAQDAPLEVQPLRPLRRREQAAVVATVERYGAFLGRPVALQLAEDATGA